MSDFESLVRPFQRPQVSYPVRIFDDTAQGNQDDVTLKLGFEGSTKTFSESFSESTSTYKDAEAKELSREVETKRIENASDPSQFVDVELIKKLSVEQGEGSKYQKINYKFENN